MPKVKCNNIYCRFNLKNICTAEEIKLDMVTQFEEGCKTWDTMETVVTCETDTVPRVRINNDYKVVDDVGPSKLDYIIKEDYKEFWYKLKNSN